MAAPTPVRSLVHSSTLVTAGIYIVVRYYSHFEENGLILIKFMAFISIFYSGRRALVEIDLKKVVAYSTLSHLRMIIFLASIGSLQASLFH
uniref:proton-conducting transporter transmembrane domain-containing protein n=2 Tax=Bacteria TaxID=2 RepID=UPI003C7A7E6E